MLDFCVVSCDGVPNSFAIHFLTFKSWHPTARKAVISGEGWSRYGYLAVYKVLAITDTHAVLQDYEDNLINTMSEQTLLEMTKALERDKIITSVKLLNDDESFPESMSD